MINYESFRSDEYKALEVSLEDKPSVTGYSYFFGNNFEQPIQAVNLHLSLLGAEHFIEEANNPDVFNGQEYKVVGDDDSSKDTAILMPSPFGNGIWPHLVARAEALRHLAVEAGVRDSKGNTVPVVMAAAPSANSSYQLDGPERLLVSNGHFEPIARRHLKLLDSLGYNAIRGFVGYSQPSVYGAPLAKEAKKDFDITGPIQIQEMPHSRKRSIAGLAVGMTVVEGMRFKKGVAAGRIDLIDELFETGNAGSELEKGVLKNRKDYLSMVRGFAAGRFAEDLDALAKLDQDTFVLWATDSAVTDATVARFLVTEKQIDSYPSKLRAIEVKGANHSYGDMVGHFAVTAAANL